MTKESEQATKVKGEYRLKSDKQNWDRKEQMEKLRHENILKEIEAMKKAKITQFVRQVNDNQVTHESEGGKK